jgi:hypothetical protein
MIKFIKQTAIEVGPAYGKRRMRVSLNNQGYNIGIHQTAILMKQANIVAICPRKRHYYPDIGNQAEIRVKTGAVYENTGSLTSVATLCGFMVSCFGFLRVD